jgi:hemerythrin
MEQFLWREGYSVNNEELDSHHRKLIGIFNKLYEFYLTDVDSIAIGQAIDELIEYTDYHFEAEVKYMMEREYIDIAAHKIEHLFFKEKISYLQYRNLMNDAEVSKELVIYLGNWLINHVLRVDKKYSI